MCKTEPGVVILNSSHKDTIDMYTALTNAHMRWEPTCELPLMDGLHKFMDSDG